MTPYLDKAAHDAIRYLVEAEVAAAVIVDDPASYGARQLSLHPYELKAAKSIRALLPSVREWVDSLDELDRARLGMALQISKLHGLLDNEMIDAPYLISLGRRVSHRDERKPLPQKFDHKKIVAHASKLAKAGAKPHTLAAQTRKDLRLPYSVRQTRTILQSAALVRRRKGK